MPCCWNSALFESAAWVLTAFTWPFRLWPGMMARTSSPRSTTPWDLAPQMTTKCQARLVLLSVVFLSSNFGKQFKYKSSTSGQDFELCVPPSVLRLAIERVNLQIASVDLSLQTAQCCGWSASMLARHRVTRAVNELNEEWRFANIPCYLSLSPGWALTQSTLYVQWDPDRDVI